jgi:hypothetical protein
VVLISNRSPKTPAGSGLARQYDDSGSSARCPIECPMNARTGRSEKKKIPLECGIADGETRTRTGDTTIFSRAAVRLKLPRFAGDSRVPACLSASGFSRSLRPFPPGYGRRWGPSAFSFAGRARRRQVRDQGPDSSSCFSRRRSCRLARRTALAGHELGDLVCVGEAAAEEPGDERDSGADCQRRGRLPLHRLDFLVPAGGVVDVARERSHLRARARDLDLGNDVNGHPPTPPARSRS